MARRTIGGSVEGLGMAGGLGAEKARAGAELGATSSDGTQGIERPQQSASFRLVLR